MQLRTLVPGLLALSLTVAGVARADVAPRHPAGPRVQLVLLSASGARGVPAEDTARVESAVRAHLARQYRRVQLCLANADLREDPMRSRGRRLELRIDVDRGGQGRATVQRDSAMPAAARSCLLEVASGVHVRPAPRGDVQVRVVYELR